MSPEAAQKKMEELMRAEGIAIETCEWMNRRSKTRLSRHSARSARKCSDTPFPFAARPQSLRGQIAIGASNHKQFGSFTAVQDVSLT